MIKNQVREDKQEKALRQLGSRWVATLAHAAPAELPGFGCRLVAGNEGSRGLYLGGEIGSALPLFAEHSGCGVILDGALYNRQDLQNELGDFMAAAGSDDAEVILAGYGRWGEDLLRRL